MPKDALHAFLIRFWTGVVITMAIGLSWEPHPPRLLVGMFMGATLWLVILFVDDRVKRR